MAYTDDAVLAKLSALNDTQESIVTVAQWVMFHRRHADRTGQLWLQRLKDSNSSKRLNLIYLANEVAQQSKARNRDDFLTAFSPVIAEATASAYRGASSDIQHKLKRVVDVWRGRQVFELPIQEAIEARLNELDKARSGGNQSRSEGGSLFGSKSSIPTELTPLVAPQQALSRSLLASKGPLIAAKQDYEKMTDPAATVPTAPVHAARLNGLLKTLAVAEGAVAESVKTRKLLIQGLEKLLQTNQAELREDEERAIDLKNKWDEIDQKKKSVEDSIMRGMGNSNPNSPVGDKEPDQEIDRPVVEALTPPGYPKPPTPEPVPEMKLDAETDVKHENGLDFSGSGVYTGYGAGAGGILKKRKLDGDEIPDLGDELDADVAAMLNS